MKKTLLLGVLLASALAANATFYTTNWTVGATVPDNNYSGWVNSQSVAAPSGTIGAGSLAVTLNLSSGWTGDLFAYLVNSSGGYAVLLDRVGTGAFGAGAGTLNITLTNGAMTSIHSFAGGTGTGLWL